MTHSTRCELDLDVSSIEPVGVLARLAAAWCTMIDAMGRRKRDRRRRRRLRSFQDLDDKMLADIGVTREELGQVLSLPLSVNAAVTMRELSQQRRRREHMGELPR